MAPNGARIGASGVESSGGAFWQGGFLPGPWKRAEKLGDLGWVGPARAGFFGFFPEWSEMAPEGPGTIIWGIGGGRGDYLGGRA